MRLIDADIVGNGMAIEWQKALVEAEIFNAPTIDPENLTIVQKLREELAKVTAERDALKGYPQEERAWAGSEPLTIEQMREMLESSEIIGAAVIVSDDGMLCHGVLDERADDGICASASADNEWLKERDYGKSWLAYTYPPAHIDREKWEAEWIYPENKFNLPRCLKCGCNSKDAEYAHKDNFCPKCGRAMNDEAWVELTKRIGVTV